MFFFGFRFLLDIFASKKWKKIGSVELEYLKKLADDLPDTLLCSKAERTEKTYTTGWQKWSHQKLDFSEIPANPKWLWLKTPLNILWYSPL